MLGLKLAFKQRNFTMLMLYSYGQTIPSKSTAMFTGAKSMGAWTFMSTPLSTDMSPFPFYSVVGMVKSENVFISLEIGKCDYLKTCCRIVGIVLKITRLKARTPS